MGVYRKLAILTRGTLQYARGMLASTLVYATSTLPYFNFFLSGTVSYSEERTLLSEISVTHACVRISHNYIACFSQHTLYNEIED